MERFLFNIHTSRCGFEVEIIEIDSTLDLYFHEVMLWLMPKSETCAPEKGFGGFCFVFGKHVGKASKI